MKKERFKKIVNQHKDIIYTQAFYFINNREDAEDITQEVFIKLWHHFDDLELKYAKAWLLRVTKNLCIDYSRKKREILLEESEEGRYRGLGLESIIDPDSNPEIEAMNNEMKQRIMAAINILPEKIRQVLIMRDIQDITYEDIAKAMDLPMNSVKVYLHRGRKRLIHYLKENSELES